MNSTENTTTGPRVGNPDTNPVQRRTERESQQRPTGPGTNRV